MEKETTEICQYCEKFDKGKCTMHKIEVCYNDESCKEYLEKTNDNNPAGKATEL